MGREAVPDPRIVLTSAQVFSPAQRVALARALVNHPKVLLLDEPLGALDLKLRKTMQLELKALQERVGITFIYVTHDQEEAMTLGDRIAVLRGGDIQQIGTPRELYERPANLFVAGFIGSPEPGPRSGVAPGLCPRPAAPSSAIAFSAAMRPVVLAVR